MPHEYTILYFDDDPLQLETFKDLFCSLYDVHTAETLAEARRVLSSCYTDIIISDHRMPEINGLDFLREAAGVCPESFRVLLTGVLTVGSVLPEVAAGVVHLFMAKPWDTQEMTEALERAIASRGMNRKPGRGRPT